MKGCSLRVDSHWVCFGVSAGAFTRDCPSPLCEEDLVCC